MALQFAHITYCRAIGDTIYGENERCSKRATCDNGLCDAHSSERSKNPRKFELDQMFKRHERERERLYDDIMWDNRNDYSMWTVKQEREWHDMLVHQEEDQFLFLLKNTKKNVTHEQRLMKAHIRKLDKRLAHRFAERRKKLLDAAKETVADPKGNAFGLLVRRERAMDLAKFAYDSQNVHTVASVSMTTKTVAELMKMEVPEGYNWHPVNPSKTPTEIVNECGLSFNARNQMKLMYSLDTAIYDICEGIYGKVLDRVWQFVKTHAEKDSLKAILRQELEDCVAMCAQGNLTRLCNVLCGYMDGVKSHEPLAERLGRRFSKIMETEDIEVRYELGLEALLENGAPMDQWDAWMGPLVEV